MQVYSTQVCYDGSFFGIFLAKSVVFYSLFFFIITSIHYFPLGLFVVLYIVTYYEQIWINIILANFFQQYKPHQNCNSGYGMPCLESQIIFYVVTFIIFFSIRFNRQLGLIRSLVTVGFAAFIFFALVWTGNYTIVQTMAGALIGIFSAIVNILLIEQFIFPDFVALQQWRVVRWMSHVRDPLKEKSKEPSGALFEPPPQFQFVR